MTTFLAACYSHPCEPHFDELPESAVFPFHQIQKMPSLEFQEPGAFLTPRTNAPISVRQIRRLEATSINRRHASSNDRRFSTTSKTSSLPPGSRALGTGKRRRKVTSAEPITKKKRASFPRSAGRVHSVINFGKGEYSFKQQRRGPCSKRWRKKKAFPPTPHDDWTVGSAQNEGIQVYEL